MTATTAGTCAARPSGSDACGRRPRARQAGADRHQPLVRGRAADHPRRRTARETRHTRGDSAFPSSQPSNRGMDEIHRIARALLDDPTHVGAMGSEPLPPPTHIHLALGSAGAGRTGRTGRGHIRAGVRSAPPTPSMCVAWLIAFSATRPHPGVWQSTSRLPRGRASFQPRVGVPVPARYAWSVRRSASSGDVSAAIRTNAEDSQHAGDMVAELGHEPGKEVRRSRRR